jgi:acetyltransferase
MFHPDSIAVIGASPRQGSLGSIILKNLLEAGFAGSLWPINPKHTVVHGLTCYKKVDSLPQAPSLAILCTPPSTIVPLIKELGEKGTKAAVVITAGLDGIQNIDGNSLQKEMLDTALPYQLRIIGPNCVGINVPGIGLNASFAHSNGVAGNLAFVSQSGALATSTLDWATTRGIGFSHFASLGNCADVDFGDMLDYLANDEDTHAILLYIESIKHAAKFMAAARAATHKKPVIALKAGRMAEGAIAATTHTGALAGADDVYDAAIRRTGMLRVLTVNDLFNTVEIFGRVSKFSGDRLLILTNGGGAGVMATDALIEMGGTLAKLSAKTIDQLDKVLPANWSKANPVDIIGDAPVTRYIDALEILLKTPDVDCILFIHCPTAIVTSKEIAEALAPKIQAATKTVLSCWLGGDSLQKARDIFSAASIPSFSTPEDAITAFLQLVNSRTNQVLLTESLTADFGHKQGNRKRAEQFISHAIEQDVDVLSEPDSKEILKAYGIPVVETVIAKTAKEAATAASRLGFPVAIKILSPDITHKSDNGGVVLGVTSLAAVKTVTREMTRHLSKALPAARLEGFTVQKMVNQENAHELIVGTTIDPTFGPVLLFGQGGTEAELIADRAVALPPINMALAQDLVSRTKVARLLAGHRQFKTADHDAIYHVLVSLSRLISDVPNIHGIDINPLLANEKGVLALDARIRIARPAPQNETA